MNIGSKVGKLTWMDAAGISVSKLLTEKVLASSPMVGNGTFRSAAIKAGAAMLLDSVMGENRLASYVKTGLVVDAMEDVAIQVLGGTLGSAGSPAPAVMVV